MYFVFALICITKAAVKFPLCFKTTLHKIKLKID